MGWQDRDYNNSRIGDMRFDNPILNFFFGSYYIGTLFRVRIRLHASLILFAIFELVCRLPIWLWHPAHADQPDRSVRHHFSA